MADSIVKTEEGSVFQHGKSNDRVYLMKISPGDYPDIMREINNLARDNDYGKIFAKVPLWMVPGFIAEGYITEAHIPRFIRDEIDIFFMSKFLSSDRLLNIETDKLRELSAAIKDNSKRNRAVLPDELTILKLSANDAKRTAALFRKVFKTYPFPIHEEQYIKQTISEGTQYYGIETRDKELIAVSSAEVDMVNLNAEMTDFAVSPDYRGQRLSVLLLEEMEVYMKSSGIKTLYTIARLNSLPMNRTFLGLGYKYSGTLIKNTNIAGTIESMNVLYKSTK